MAGFFRGGSIRDNLAHALAMSYGMSGAVEVADDLLAQTGISAELTRLRAENERLREDVLPTVLGFLVLADGGSMTTAEALERATKVARESLEASDE